MYFDTLDVIKFKSNQNPTELVDGKITRIEKTAEGTYYWIGQVWLWFLLDIDRYSEEQVKEWNPRLKYNFTWPM